MDPHSWRDTGTVEDTELRRWQRQSGVSPAQVGDILQVKSLDGIWGLHS